MWSQFDGEHDAGAARWRRERSLRSNLKYARMSVAMALAEARHHTAPRQQTTARAEATNDALRSQTTSVARDTEFFSLYEEELGSTRPDRLFEVGEGPAAHRRADRRPHAHRAVA